MAKIVQGASSFCVKTAASLLWCIHNINAVKQRKSKSCLHIVNDQVCVGWLDYIIFHAILWRACFKKSSRTSNCQREPVACRKRRYLELDEVWSFVFVKTAKYWLWTALVAGHARLLHLCSVTTALKLANDCGTRFQKIIELVTPLVISGMPIRRFFLRKHIGVSARTQARPIIWSVGIAHYVSD